MDVCNGNLALQGLDMVLQVFLISVLYMQYLQHLHSVARPILEKYALLVCVGVVWAFAAILTVAGAYNNVREQTRQSCRTDRSHLIQAAPWYYLCSYILYSGRCMYPSSPPYIFHSLGSRFRILFSGVPLYSEQAMYLVCLVLHLFQLLRLVLLVFKLQCCPSGQFF